MPDATGAPPDSTVVVAAAAADPKVIAWTPVLVATTLGIFILAGLAEIGGGWLVWQKIREHKPWYYLLAGELLSCTAALALHASEAAGPTRGLHCHEHAWLAPAAVTACLPLPGPALMDLCSPTPNQHTPLLHCTATHNWHMCRSTCEVHACNCLTHLLRCPCAGFVVLCCYGLVPTLQPPEASFARVYAVYGGIFVIMSYAWGWAVDGDRPDAGDGVGSAIMLAGALLAWFWPRSKGPPA
jgi:drug/metabolite transporter superfamily protein YnfA